MLTVNEIYNELKNLFPEVYCELNYQNHYQLIIAVVLSAQTTDASVNRVTKDLFLKYPTFLDLMKANFDDVHELIKMIGLSNIKTKNIIALSKKIVLEKAGIVVPDFDYLITLPGVGRKTANVVLSEGFKIPRMPVDTHVLRVSNRLGLVNSDNPEVVEKELMRIFDSSLYYEVHLRLIHFGRYFCKAVKPNCQQCKFISFCHYYTKKHPK